MFGVIQDKKYMLCLSVNVSLNRDGEREID